MDRETHILHVFPTFVPGGAQVRTAAVINGLGGAWRHSVVPLDGRTGAEKRIRAGITVSLVEAPHKQNVRSMAQLIRSVRPDLLITYNWGAIEATAAGWLYSLCPVLHTEDGFGADEASGPKLRRALARRLVLNRIHRTAVPSQTLLRIALAKYGLSPDKVTLIVNGIDVERFQPRRNPELREELGIPKNALLFGSAGHLREEKNLSLLLRAFAAAVPGAYLLLLGDGPCRAELESLARDLAIRDRVIFAGHKEDTSPYYAALDVFVMSSSTEQMPLSLLEAMACGLPAVCTDAGDTAEMLGEPAVPRGNLPAYTEALRRMAASPELRSGQGARNRARAVEMYSQTRMIKAYEELYRSALRPAATMD